MSAKCGRESFDLSEHFAETGLRPQNFLIEGESEERFKEHPKLQELLRLKNALVKERSHPELYLKKEIRGLDPDALGKFDVIIVDPPWAEYFQRIALLELNLPGEKTENWTLEEIRRIPVPALAATPSFIFLWVGSEHLDHGRYLFKQWGIKRCEDIVWVKTRLQPDALPTPSDANSLLRRTKEHCLVGIFGDPKQASAPAFIHANIDTDVILQEEPELGNFNKPAELQEIAERFCLGRKRLELFANNNSIRPGWLCVGKDLRESNFDKKTYEQWFEGESRPHSFLGGRLLQTTPAIESLRPKSPSK